jgi:hypothetical protein
MVAVDREELAKKAIVFLVGKANPQAGAVVQALVAAFWPSNRDVWSEIREQVERLVDQKIETEVYKQAAAALKGYQAQIQLFGSKIAEGVNETIRGTFLAIEPIFTGDIEKFRVESHEVLLLPFFAQAATMHLSLLHDAANHGKAWGMDIRNIDGVSQRLEAAKTAYKKYVTDTIAAGLKKVRERTGRNDHQCQPFRDVNKFTREMTLMAADFADLWPVFGRYDTPPKTTMPSREIYSDPFGTADDSGDIFARLRKPPSKPISEMTIWGSSQINSIEVKYPAGGGPGGGAGSGRMGVPKGGSDLPPKGGRIRVQPDNPITAARVRADHVVDALQFGFRNGQTTREFGGGSTNDKVAFDDHVLSSVHINGISKFYNCADSAVFGFKYDPSAPISTDVLQLLHASSPKQLSIAELIEETGSDIDRRELEAVASAERWDAKRKSFWAAAKRRKKL